MMPASSERAARSKQRQDFSAGAGQYAAVAGTGRSIPDYLIMLTAAGGLDRRPALLLFDGNRAISSTARATGQHLLSAARRYSLGTETAALIL